MGRRKDIEQKRFYKDCPSCGAEQSYGRSDHYKKALKNNWLCSKCGQKDRGLTKWYEGIRLSWWQKVEKNAVYRDLEFSITPEFIWEVYLSQDKKCALTGLDIGWSSIGQDHTVSVDRVDSSYGYTEDNVWLVHKDVNMMKQSLHLEDFISYCKLIAKNAQ